jgi:hypothetical protein
MHSPAAITPRQAKLARLFRRVPTFIFGAAIMMFWQLTPLIPLGIILFTTPTETLPEVAASILQLMPIVQMSGLIVGGLFMIAIPNYAQIMSPFLPEGMPCDIPADKYQRDLNILSTASEPITALGFEEYDRFYIGGFYRVIVIIYQHPDMAMQWAAYRLLGRTNAFAIKSYFGDDLTLETSSFQGGGKLPIHPSAYFQIGPAKNCAMLLNIHQDTIAVFQEHGYELVPMGNPRDALLRSLQRQSQLIRGFKYWPIRMTLWMIFRSNFRYRKTLREQIAAGTTHIPPQP